jgi:hypothetical protein
MNLQVIASPRGDVLWVFGALPGSVHDKKAEWVWGVLARLYLRRLRRLRVAGGRKPSLATSGALGGIVARGGVRVVNAVRAARAGGTSERPLSSLPGP